MSGGKGDRPQLLPPLLRRVSRRQQCEGLAVERGVACALSRHWRTALGPAGALACATWWVGRQAAKARKLAREQASKVLTGKASGMMCRLGEGQGAGVTQKRHEAGVWV